MKSFDYSTYLSPFTWRYGSDEMRKIWSEVYKRKLWRKIWVELAHAQYKEGLVNKKELDDLIKYQDDVDIEKAHEIEKEIKHDLMAEIKTFASQAKIGGGKIHLGATSMDIEDNADTIRYKESLIIIEQNLKKLLKEFSKKINQYKDFSCMAYTHLQPAEPTTLGYRFCLYAQDLLLDLQFLQFVKTMLKGKGFKGAVGTSASYALLMNNKKAEKMEKTIMQKLGVDAFDISSQVAPRKIEYFVSSLLSSISQSLYKFAFDLRIMQSPGFSEWQEPFGKKQVGSSAMPFKRNPIKSEQICSLARLVFNLSNVTTDNAANMLLERTLDDSANRRIIFPEMFLTTDQILTNAITIVSELVINEKQIEKNLDTYGPFSSTEAVLVTAVKNGANRQEMHEILRELSMKAWVELQKGQTNPLTDLIIYDKRIMQFIKVEQLKKLFDPKTHIGLAPQKCQGMVKSIQEILK
ncbi:MAG: adenylosuccinate lyase [bacterium]|nr:adenylosuccinate lyase [bacterium]